VFVEEVMAAAAEDGEISVVFRSEAFVRPVMDVQVIARVA
jgi:hypothetical protein